MYKELKDLNGVVRSDVILRIADEAFIPVDNQNRDYQYYMAWIAEGNTILPA